MAVAVIVAMVITLAFMAMTVRCGAQIRSKSRVKAGIERRVIVGIVSRVKRVEWVGLSAGSDHASLNCCG